MSKEKFLTIRWNNILSMALGLPAAAFVLAAFSSTLWTSKNGMIILSVIGAVY